MEAQTKHNSLLLGWDRELFQDPINTPTSLSFCDIPISELSELDHQTDSSLNHDMFEFPTATNPKEFSPSGGGTLDHYIIFCGQLIATQNQEVTQKKVGRHQQDKAKKTPSKKTEKSPAGGKVYRRHATMRNKDVMIGFGRNIAPARMEMRDIKERQKRKAVAAAGEKDEVVVVATGDRSLVVVDGRGSDGAGKGQWRLLRTLRFRAYLSNVLNKASLGLGCFSIPPTR